jgi:hypothetical protein
MTIHKRTSIMPCSKVLRHIQTELDSKLNQTAYRKIQQHLENCPICMCYLDSLKKVVYLYRYYFDIRPNTTSHKKLWAAIRWKMRP